MSEALLQTYQDVKSDLRKVVRKHRRKYGGREDDLLADANLLFVSAYLDYDERSPFRYYVAYIVSKKLLHARRKELNRQRILPRDEEVDADTLPSASKGGFDVDEYCDSLSDDATAVVRLVFRPPTPLVKRLRHKGVDTDVRTQGGSVKFRAALLEYLKSKGWSKARVVRTFNEIKEQQ